MLSPEGLPMPNSVVYCKNKQGEKKYKDKSKKVNNHLTLKAYVEKVISFYDFNRDKLKRMDEDEEESD